VSDVAAMSTWNDLLRRLRTSLGWVAAQFWGTLLIVLAGVGWTRVPEKHAWQVGLTLLLPLVMLAAMLVLEAGTMRGFLQIKERRVRFASGALTLLVWIAVVWIAWVILDWCGDQIPLWAGYLNSRASAHARATVFTYQHIATWLSILVWVWRWIVVPAKVIPHALASAQWGWRLPCRKLLRMLLNWRWWLAAVIAALVGVLLPSYFFHGEPHGTPAHQVWAVILKVAGAYLLAAACWILLLAWAAVLLARQSEPAKDALDGDLLHRFYEGRRWIAGIAVWTLIGFLLTPLMNHLPESIRTSIWYEWSSAIVMLVSLLFLQAALWRGMIGRGEKRVWLLWGLLMIAAWALPGLAFAILLSVYHCPDYLVALCWVFVPGALIPFAAASAQWGPRLPWRRVLRVFTDWRWWLGVLAAVIAGVAIPTGLMSASTGSADSSQGDLLLLRTVLSAVLLCGSWVALSGWVVVMLFHTRSDAGHPADDSLVPAPVAAGPLGKDSVKLPLPEKGNDAGGNI